MATVEIHEDLYAQKHVLRWTGEELLSTANRVASALEGLTAELKRLNDRDDITPDFLERVTAIRNAFGLDDSGEGER